MALGIIDRLAGWSQHPSIPHVLYKVTPTSRALILDAKCQACNDTFHWECLNKDRAAWRIDNWAMQHHHGVLARR